MKSEPALCHVPQEDFEKGSKYIAKSHSPRVIANAIKFKHKAYKGADDIGHKELAASIQKHIKILDKALEIDPDGAEE